MTTPTPDLEPVPSWTPTAQEVWDEVLPGRAGPDAQRLIRAQNLINRVARNLNAELPDPFSSLWAPVARWYVTLASGALIDLTLFPEQRDDSIAAELDARAGAELVRLRALVAGAAPGTGSAPVYWSGTVSLAGLAGP